MSLIFNCRLKMWRSPSGTGLTLLLLMFLCIFLFPLVLMENTQSFWQALTCITSVCSCRYVLAEASCTTFLTFYSVFGVHGRNWKRPFQRLIFQTIDLRKAELCRLGSSTAQQQSRCGRERGDDHMYLNGDTLVQCWHSTFVSRLSSAVTHCPTVRPIAHGSPPSLLNS